MSVPVMRHTSTKPNFVIVIINPSLHETTKTALPSLNSMMLAVPERLALAGNHVFCHPEIPGAHNAADVDAGRFSRMVSAPTIDPLPRLRIFTKHVVIADVVLGFQVSLGGGPPVLV